MATRPRRSSSSRRSSSTQRSSSASSPRPSVSSSRRGRSLSRTPPHTNLDASSSSASTNPSTRTPHHGHRLSKRRRGSIDVSVDSSISSRGGDGAETPDSFILEVPPATRPLTKPRRHVESCIEWGMPSKLCCSGCNTYASTRGLLLDEKDPIFVAAVTKASIDRQRLRGPATKCRQLWKMEESDLTIKDDKLFRRRQLHFIEHMVESRPPTPRPMTVPSPPTIPEESTLADDSPIAFAVIPPNANAVAPTPVPAI